MGGNKFHYISEFDLSWMHVADHTMRALPWFSFFYANANREDRASVPQGASRGFCRQVSFPPFTHAYAPPSRGVSPSSTTEQASRPRRSAPRGSGTSPAKGAAVPRAELRVPKRCQLRQALWLPVPFTPNPPKAHWPRLDLKIYSCPHLYRALLCPRRRLASALLWTWAVVLGCCE